MPLAKFSCVFNWFSGLSTVKASLRLYLVLFAPCFLKLPLCSFSILVVSSHRQVQLDFQQRFRKSGIPLEDILLTDIRILIQLFIIGNTFLVYLQLKSHLLISFSTIISINFQASNPSCVPPRTSFSLNAVPPSGSTSR